MLFLVCQVYQGSWYEVCICFGRKHALTENVIPHEQDGPGVTSKPMRKVLGER